MGTWERIQRALRREKRDFDDSVKELETKANAALDQRERELHATPAEKLAIEQQRAADIDAELDAVRKRIEGGGSGT